MDKGTKKSAVFTIAGLVAISIILGSTGLASAAFPGENGKIRNQPWLALRFDPNLGERDGNQKSNVLSTTSEPRK